jgi:hypothetical protein
MKHKVNFVFDNVFSSFVLPNATMPEIGVMNYLSSLYSTKKTGATIFETGISLKDMFEDEYGHWPISCTGFFYHASVYNTIINPNEEAIYFAKRSTEAFIYPIKPSPSLNNFFGISPVNGKNLIGEYFWKYISKQTIKHIFQNRVKILIDYSMEPYIDFNTYLDIHKSIEYSGLPNDSVIICINSFNAKELYESWFPLEQRKLKIINLPFCLDHSSWFFNTYINQGDTMCMNEQNFFDSKSKIRDNHFLMKMRNNRPHRLALLYKLVSTNDVLSKADWSFYALQSVYQPDRIKQIEEEFAFETLDLDKIKELYDTQPHKLKSENNQNVDDINAWTDLNFEQYINSYFEVCFETFIDGEHKSLTEKVFKPIINFQPFLFVAFPGALELLKSLGFKTFEGFIDESYDNEPDQKIRMNKIYNEIVRLSAMSKEEIHNWYWQMEDILLHNHRTLKNYNNVKIFGEELIGELADFCKGKQIKWEI